MSLRLLLIDDHPLFVEGFQAMTSRLRPEWRVEIAGTGRDALDCVDTHPPGIVVLDVVLPDIDGFDLLQRIKKFRPALPVVLVSGRDHATMTMRARASLADGFIPKTTPPCDFIGLIERTLTGHGAWPSSLATGDVPTLTPRQAEVLELLAAGNGNKEIRYRLGIAERTVRAHLTELFQVLGVHGRMPAVVRARELGLIE